MKNFGVRASIALMAALMIAVGGIATSASAAPQDDVITITNQQRYGAGLLPLTRDATLDRAAQEWAQHLSSTRTMVHSSNEWRQARIPAGWRTHGENIAYGYATPSTVMAGWMGSTGHRENILRSTFTHIGVGYVPSGNYWVQIFAGYQGSVSTFEIDRVHQSLGGVTGVLGAPTTGYNVIADHGGGVVRGYSGGAIAWSQGRGAFPITGEVRAKFNASGGIAAFGWPTSGVNQNPASGGGSVQGFQFAAVTVHASAGTFVLSGSLRAHFNSVGGLGGPLGWPTGVEACSAGVCSQTFQGGSVFWSSTRGGAHVLKDFMPVFSSSGGVGGSLGWPTSGEVPIAANGGGKVQGFDKGAIVSSPSGGVRILVEPVRGLFNAAGGIAGKPGWPASNVACGSGGECKQSFQAGSVYYDKSGSGGFVPSQLEGAYAASGGPVGSVGLPTSAANALAARGGGTVQGFAGGAIAHSPSGGAHVISGNIRAYFNAQGGVAGYLGWPTSGENCTSAGVCSQSFNGGTVTWTPGVGGRVS